MNLHPVTLLFILILAAFFYSQGFLFFFFATLVIGFLLLIASLTSSAASGGGYGDHDGKSVYPDKMTIEVKGEVPPAFGGEKDFAQDFVGGAGVVGRTLKAIWNFKIDEKPKKKEEAGGEKKTNGGHGGH